MATAALCVFRRLHAQLGEDEEATKLYTRFVATVATSEVCVYVCVCVCVCVLVALEPSNEIRVVLLLLEW